MGYTNVITVPRSTSKRVKFNNFKLNMDVAPQKLNENYSPMTYNFKSSSKVLQNGLGVKPFRFLNNTVMFDKQFDSTDGELVYYRYYNHNESKQEDKLVIFSGELNEIYYVDLQKGNGELKKLNITSFMQKPQIINYRLDGEDVLIMASAKDSLTVWDSSEVTQTVSEAPSISSMCVHYERLFATDSKSGTMLWFSDDLDPRNWNVSMDEAGFIEIVDAKGKLLKVLSFADYVYIFRSYGISRLSAYAEQTSFSVQELFTSMGRIFEKSIALCGDRIMFVANDGLYVFDGASAKKLQTGINSMLEKADFSMLATSYFESKYYIAFRYDFSDDKMIGCENNANFVNNVIVEYDIGSGEVSITRGIDVVSMLALVMDESSANIVLYRNQGKMLVGELTESGDVVGDVLTKCYTLPKMDFGELDKRKVLKKICINATKDVEININADGKRFNFFIKSGTKTGKNVCILAYVFEIEIISDCQDCVILDVVLDVEVVK